MLMALSKVIGLSCQLRISLLGTPRFELADGRPVTGLGPKAVAVLACLAVQPGQRLGRSDLVGLIWADLTSSSAARHALRQCLLRLRVALGPGAVALGADGDALWLESGRFRSDLYEVRQALAGKDDAWLCDLSPRVSGEFCAGLEAKSAVFEDWLRQQRQVADGLCAQLHARAAMICAAAGALPQAIDAAHRRLSVEPYEEAAHAALIALLIQAGRRQAAVDAREACMALFKRDLGVLPGPLVQQAPLADPVPAALPEVIARPARRLSGGSRGAIAASVLAALTASFLMQHGPDVADPVAAVDRPAAPAPQAWITAAATKQAPEPGSAAAGQDAALRLSIGKMLEGDVNHAMLYPVGC